MLVLVLVLLLLLLLVLLELVLVLLLLRALLNTLLQLMAGVLGGMRVHGLAHGGGRCHHAHDASVGRPRHVAARKHQLRVSVHVPRRRRRRPAAAATAIAVEQLHPRLQIVVHRGSGLSGVTGSGLDVMGGTPPLPHAASLGAPVLPRQL